VRQDTNLVLNQPIQLWLPWLTDNLSSPEAQRDVQRVMVLWKHELRVWLLPELKKPKKWHKNEGQFRFSVLGVPAEHTDQLDVLHIGCNGEVFGPNRQWWFPEGLNGLLDAWLNLYNLEGGITYYRAPETFNFSVPKVVKDRIRSRNSKFRFVPGPTWSIDEVDKRTRTVKLKWPPSGSNAAPVSPEAESVNSG
jgi:hypothetical protein